MCVCVHDFDHARSQLVILLSLLNIASFGVHRWDFFETVLFKIFSQHELLFFIYNGSFDKGGYYLQSQMIINPIYTHILTYTAGACLCEVSTSMAAVLSTV